MPVRGRRPAASTAPATRTGSAGWGLAAALLLMALAIAVPGVTGWNVRVRWFPPLHAEWAPRLGPGTGLALALGALGAWRAVDWAQRLAWTRLLAASFVGGVAWLAALALVDGPDGISQVLEHPYEYLGTARATTDVGATLGVYVSRISYDAEPDNWPVHIAGHPPGALLFFVALVRLGLGGGFAAGAVVTVVAATTAPAVLCTLRALGAEELARRAAPLLVLGPAAIWQSVSADAVFAAVAAWGMAVLAIASRVAATRRGSGAMAAWAALAGLLLGYTVMMSYGLPLLGILALVVLWTGGSWRPLPVAMVSAVSVVAAFAVAGFAYWEALPELHERYWDGVGGRRPAAYWMWGNLAALLFSAGPLAAVGLTRLVEMAPGQARSRGPVPGPVVAWRLAVAGWLMVLAADLSQMSKAEVERIWLPFVPWLLVATALLPERWRRRGLALQVGVALVVQHLLVTSW